MAFGRRSTETLLESATSTITSPVVEMIADSIRTYSADMQATGASSATISVYGSSSPTRGFSLITTFTLSTTGSGSDTANQPSNVPWRYVYAQITALSGPCNVSVYVGL